ncbi:MAG: NifB/NifX family molybdenum-iron cluster-binding protein [Chloroflexota bacterium]
MKIAFVSDDHQTISAHFGRGLFYEIYIVENGKVINHESISRSFPMAVNIGEESARDGEHQHKHDHNAMLTPIEDCLALISRGMGRGAHVSLQEHDIQPIITDIQEIQTALAAYMNGTLVDHPEKLH